jgi:hypothetical protein
MADHFHLAVSWDWEYDREFIATLESQIHAHRLRFYSISHHNTHETVRRLQKGELSFGAFLDRAAEADENFVPVARAMRKHGALILNPPEATRHAADKATMHLEFLTTGIHVPFTIIISPYEKKRELEFSVSELAHLGRPFIIKPANTTGGGVGVILGAETLKDVIDSRQHHNNDKYLLQEKIRPLILEGRKAWFRVFYAFGEILPAWWDDETHLYGIVTKSELTRFALRPLITTTRKIWEVCHLDFFSTEIAVPKEKRPVVVDYVNEICDMRLQSMHPDGVPDVLVTEICRRFARDLRSSLK